MCLSRFGGDLLSHVLRRSTIGATALNGRVRDGIGPVLLALMTTKPRKTHAVRFRFGKDTIQVSIPGRVCFRSAKAGQPGFYWIKSSLSGN